MPLTPGGLPYPLATDPPNGPLQIQQLAEAVDPGLFARPWFQGRQSSNQSIPNSTATTVAVANVAAQGTFTNTAGVIKVGKAGTYLAIGHLTWTSSTNTTGARLAYIRKNGATAVRVSASPTGIAQPVTLNVAVILPNLLTTDDVDLAAFHGAGSALALDGSNSQCQLYLIYLGN